ncbi:MAG TPA: hypothetical protein VGR00_06325, partial [Thermoanaerobaculia bacterium]|nr:hypothetical protein [Thermoanaerobaculia bacterium]
MKTSRIALPVFLLLALSSAPVRGACALVVTGATISPVENASFNGTVATFTGGGLVAEYTADVNWGDGGDSAATLSGTGPFTVTGTHTYRDEGSFTVTVKIHRTNGEVGTGTGTANVADATLVGNPNTLHLTAGVVYTGVIGTFDDPAPHTTASTNDNYVAQAYQDLLGRAASAMEISNGVTQLMSITRTQFADNVLNSTEGRSVAIDALYRAYLNRAVDGVGLSSGLSFLSGGGTYDQLKSNLLGSMEYFV